MAPVAAGVGGAVEGTVVVGEAAVGNAAIVGAGQTLQDGFGVGGAVDFENRAAAATLPGAAMITTSCAGFAVERAIVMHSHPCLRETLFDQRYGSIDSPHCERVGAP